MFLDNPIILLSAIAVVAGLGELANFLWQTYFALHADQYFVRWVTNEQKELLKHADVPFTAKSYDQEGDGILLARRDFRRAKRVLKGRVVDNFVIQGYQVHEAVLTYTPANARELSRYKVTFDGKPKNKRLVHAIVHDVLLPSVKKNIVVHTGFGEIAEPVQDDNFHVFVWSSPQHASTVSAPSKLMGAPVPNRSGTLANSGTGVPVIDTASAFEVAEIVGNCVYIHLDIDTGPALSFYRRVLNGGRRYSKPALGLLTRILQMVDEELSADEFLAEIVKQATASQKADPNFNPAAYTVTALGFDIRRQQVITSLAKDILLPTVRKNIVVRNSRGMNEPVIHDGQFYLYFNASPMGSACIQTPDRLWGYRLLKRGMAFAPSAEGLPVADDSGFIVGELIGDNFYLHQEYIFYGCKAEAALLARLMLQVRDEMACEDCGTDGAIKKRVLDHFQKECARQVSGSGGQTARVAQADVTKAQSDYRDLLKGTRLEEINLMRLQSAPNEELGREYDELLKLHNVVDVTVTNDVIIVKTKTLYCVHPKTHQKHEIGAFEIHISTHYSSVKWFNKTRTVRGGHSAMNAPHVDENGNACFGNTKDLFPMLIGKREFASVVQLAIAFVESVNLDDNWGKFIVNWPVVE